MYKIRMGVFFISVFFSLVFLAGASFAVDSIPFNESLNDSLTWTTGGDVPWGGYHNGTQNYAQSGHIGDSQRSWIQTTVKGKGTISFNWLASSQKDWDTLIFYIDGQQRDQISGDTGWISASYTISSSFDHVLKWEYSKDYWPGSANGDYGRLNSVKWSGPQDNNPPTVSSLDPINGALVNIKNKVVTITFSEAIKAGNAFDSISVKNSGGNSVSITKLISGNILTLTNTGTYSNGTYTVTIPVNAVIDLSNNGIASIYTSNFTIDATAPVVKTSSPVKGATNVARNKTITVTFSENIKSGTNYSKITLKSSTGKTITITKSISGKVLTIKHSSKLAAKTKYILTLYSGCVKDAAGNPLATKTITFTTGST